MTTSKRIRVIGPKDRVPHDAVVLDVTSRGLAPWREFSPMLLGPVKLYGPYGSFNVENAWQFCKVYREHVNPAGDPNPKYWAWAYDGWADTYAHRYPMGKGAKPLYSFWDHQKLDYIEARKQIYVPLYQAAVKAKPALFKRFVKFVATYLEDGVIICLFDFDGYDHKALDMSYEDVLNDSTRKMGHAFVLAEMLERALNEKV